MDDLAMNSKYLEQQMKMIWKLPWWFYVEERILRKTKKSGVLAPAHISLSLSLSLSLVLSLSSSTINKGHINSTCQCED